MVIKFEYKFKVMVAEVIAHKGIQKKGGKLVRTYERIIYKRETKELKLQKLPTEWVRGLKQKYWNKGVTT